MKHMFYHTGERHVPVQFEGHTLPDRLVRYFWKRLLKNTVPGVVKR